jgi:hypothetical protein
MIAPKSARKAGRVAFSGVGEAYLVSVDAGIAMTAATGELARGDVTWT